MGRPFFIFDFDATAFRKNYTYLLFLTCVQMGLIPKVALLPIDKAYRAYVNRQGSYDAFLHALLHAICSEARFEGIRVSDMKQVCDVLATRSCHQTHVFWEALLSASKDCGYGTLIITGSPEPAVSAFCEKREIEHFIGTRMAERNGVYIGDCDDSALRDKCATLQHFAASHHVDLDRSIVLGDSIHDLSMMKLVKYPLTINPTIELAKSCSTCGIPVVHEKRGMIFLDKWEDGRRVEARLFDILPSAVALSLDRVFQSQGGLI